MRWRGLIAGTLLLAVISIPGRSCGPFFLEAEFTSHTVDLEALRNGTPAVIPLGAGTSTLAIAYRILNGPPVTSAEWNILNSKPEPSPDPGVAPHNPSVFTQWANARKAVLPNAGVASTETERHIPGNDWESYSNCLDDAYANAARTLAARQKLYPEATADLANWAQAQDAVFSNCAAVGQLPTQLPVSAPLWLRQDRAYQTAAAHFYRLEWLDAIAGFEAIAADSASPWHDLAAYLVARTLIRQATLGTKDYGFDPALMHQAEQRLMNITAAHGPMAGPAGQLLDYVQVRVSPGIAAARIGDRISKPDPTLQQDLIDLRYAINRIGQVPPIATRTEELRKSPLADWVFTMGYGGAYDDSAQRWRQTHSTTWLVPAIARLKAPDPELFAAAAEVPSTSPAWATVTYARLSLARHNPAAQSEIEKVRTELTARHADLSTRNLFSMLARDNATSIGQYMSLAPMQPITYTDYEGFDGFSQPSDKFTMAGLPVNTSSAFRLDLDTAIILNRKLPLSSLVPLVLESTWPKQLRFELAMAVWTRAVLLDRPAEARRLTSVLIDGEPGWKPLLAAYDAASTPQDRTVTGLLALMRFPAVRPYINAGPGRDEGFVGYSVLRDNWWCGGMGSLNYSTGYNYSYAYQQESDTDKKTPVAPLPGFITPEMTAQATRELNQLLHIGDAPAYFGQNALTWAKAHPSDPRSPELLGFTFRAMRNGCNLEASAPLKRQVFETLHAWYPQSEWSKRYPNVGEPDGLPETQ